MLSVHIFSLSETYILSALVNDARKHEQKSMGGLKPLQKYDIVNWEGFSQEGMKSKK